MIIPWQQLEPQVLYAFIEEIVTRDGTDYGLNEMATDTKIQQLLKQLKLGSSDLVWDSETETGNIISRN